MSIEVGLRAPHSLFGRGPDGLARFAAGVEAAGIDRVWVGDHVSFRGGQGYDGLLQAAVLAALTRTVTVQTAVYLLPLRHPLPVARQVATIAEMAPGRFAFGVGIGGDDRDEASNCGVDPATRGRRMDESLPLVRRLLAGEVVDHEGAAFSLHGAEVRPAPARPVPVVVGGRSPSALRRAGRYGDGWLGVFVDPDRFAASAEAVAAEAESAGRPPVTWRHGLLAWCGLAGSAAEARALVAPAVEGLYQMPFERFERYVPYGRPEDVAERLAPFVAAGASTLLLGAVAPDPDAAIEGVAAIRDALSGSTPLQPIY